MNPGTLTVLTPDQTTGGTPMVKDKALRDAAPDLLEATKALLNCLTYSGSVGLESSQQRQKARNMARAAIAKATQEDKS